MDYEKYMRRALELAALAAAEGEVPVGCVIADGAGRILGEGRNRREATRCVTGHAEIEALDAACRARGDWRLDDCTAFVTLEPCPMCAGAIINSRIVKVTFGAYDKKAGSLGSLVNLFDLPYNHKPEIEGGFMEAECAALLSDFFRRLREKR